jgi:ATP-dependent Lhr-like helicase
MGESVEKDLRTPLSKGLFCPEESAGGSSSENARANLLAWFERKRYRPSKFQVEAWNAYDNGKSGLIHVPTGSGKTLAAFGAPLSHLKAKKGLQVLYLSPLRAVIRDIELAVDDVCREVCPEAIIESRTGDTAAKIRARQAKRLPDVLLTTPESLSLLISKSDSLEKMKNLQAVILDEWHELMGSKRGVQVELALSHILAALPDVRVWALSGTIANLEEAAEYAVGTRRQPTVISHKMDRPIVISTIAPEDPRSIPWVGHLGLKMLPEVLRELDDEKSILIFTNTRSQAELWFQAILAARPDMAGAVALHHSSLDAKTRTFVEESLKDGRIQWVVCTSSLDLGVDYSKVEKVIQIGSAKGVARLLQRAGRANHRPNEASPVSFVPTQAMEALEIAAIRRAAVEQRVEARKPPTGAIDVLEQHLVTLACAGPYDPEEIFSEVRATRSYADLSRESYDWVVDHLTNGGSLAAYAQFRKLVFDDERKLRVASPLIARFHRMSIGTIVSDAMISVYLTNKRKLGSAEERYLARMKPGDKFLFAGRTLEFVMIRDMKAYARPARGKTTHTPRWLGGKLPISDSLCAELRRLLGEVSRATSGRRTSGFDPEEWRILEPLWEAQRRVSMIPNEREILVEFSRSKEGAHVFLFLFEGRLVHEGLAAVLAYRLARREKGTFGLSVSDYGIELLSEDPAYPLRELFVRGFEDLLSEKNLLEDLTEGLRMGEFARRHFREIARVSGMTFQGYPGSEKTARQLQVSSSLIYDVLSQHEPGNLLLRQAEREVLERQFEWGRMSEALARVRTSTPLFVETERFSPFSFPLVFERMAAKVSTESLQDRLNRMKERWLAPAARGIHA